MIELLEKFIDIDKEIREKLKLRIDRPIVIKDCRHLNYDLLKIRGMINFIYPSVNFRGNKMLIRNDRRSGETTRFIQMIDGLDLIVDTYGHDRKQDERIEIIILDSKKRVNIHQDEQALNVEISDYILDLLRKAKRI